MNPTGTSTDAQWQQGSHSPLASLGANISRETVAYGVFTTLLTKANIPTADIKGYNFRDLATLACRAADDFLSVASNDSISGVQRSA